MDSKTNIAVLIAAVIAVSSSPVKSDDFFTDKGSIWTGGTFSYSNETYSGQTVNVFMLSPAFRFFPAKYFLVGPAFAWRDMSSSYSGDNYSSGNVYFGPELGFAYGNHRVIPYVISGVQYAHSYSTDTYSSGYMGTTTSTQNSDGYQIPLNIGMMVQLVDNMGFQFELGVTYNHAKYSPGTNVDVTIVSFSIGICGIGKKTALSLLSSFRGLIY
jgi:hypothetical protein